MSTYKNIETENLKDIEKIRHPHSHEVASLDSMALEVFTDFDEQGPLVLEQSVSLDSAIELMKKAHVRLKLVIDKEEHFRGVISLSDLLSDKVMKAMETTGLRREDLTIADVMTHKDSLRGIEMDKFRHARIGDILSTMELFGGPHMLVIDATDNSIRGIVSSSDIVRTLHVPVHINERANSFADVYSAIHG